MKSIWKALLCCISIIGILTWTACQPTEEEQMLLEITTLWSEIMEGQRETEYLCVSRHDPSFPTSQTASPIRLPENIQRCMDTCKKLHISSFSLEKPKDWDENWGATISTCAFVLRSEDDRMDVPPMFSITVDDEGRAMFIYQKEWNSYFSHAPYKVTAYSESCGITAKDLRAYADFVHGSKAEADFLRMETLWERILTGQETVDTVTLRELAESHVKELKNPETIREFITTCQLLRTEKWVIGECPTKADARTVVGFVREQETLLKMEITNDGYVIFSTKESKAYCKINDTTADKLYEFHEINA